MPLMKNAIDAWCVKDGRLNAQLAEVFGVSESTVSRWRNGKLRPEFDRLPSLKKITGLTDLQLLGLEPPPSKRKQGEAA